MTDKFIFRFVAAVSVFVFAVVLVLNRKLIPVTVVPVTILPMLNAVLNSTYSDILLLTSLYFIKQKKITIHKRINITAFCLSSLFLISYILLHYHAP